MTMKDLYLVGAGGLGREVLNMILQAEKTYGPKWNIKGFLDDTEDPLKGKEVDRGVVGTIVDYMPKPNDALLMCIADPKAKQKLVPMLKARGAFFDSFISPGASMGNHNSIGEGAIVYPGFNMSVNVRIGCFATLLACICCHDVTIGDFCTISDNCGLLGYVKVGNGVFLGDSVRIAPHVEVGDNTFACMGSIITRDVLPGSKVGGEKQSGAGLHYLFSILIFARRWGILLMTHPQKTSVVLF